jgi:kynureninase
MPTLHAMWLRAHACSVLRTMLKEHSYDFAIGCKSTVSSKQVPH